MQNQPQRQRRSARYAQQSAPQPQAAYQSGSYQQPQPQAAYQSGSYQQPQPQATYQSGSYQQPQPQAAYQSGTYQQPQPRTAYQSGSYPQSQPQGMYQSSYQPQPQATYQSGSYRQPQPQGMYQSGYQPQPQAAYQSGSYRQPQPQGMYQSGYQPQPQAAYQSGYQQPVQRNAQGSALPPQQMYRSGTWQNAAGGPPPTPPTYRAGNTSPEGDDEPPRRSPVKVILLLVLLALLIVGIVVGVGAVRRRIEENRVTAVVTPYDTLFCQGVYVDGIHLGGMTQQEGYDAVSNQAFGRRDSWSVQLTYGGQVIQNITADMLGMTVDVYDVIADAWSQGHTGDLHEREAAMLALQQSPYTAYTAIPGGDTSIIDTILAGLRDQVYQAPQDAALVSFNPEYTDPFVFQEEVNGRTLNIAPIKEQLYQMVSTLESGEIPLEPETIYADLTVAELKKDYTLRGTGMTEISSSSTENRTQNIRTSFQAISGTILQPGETFSFNSVVGQRTEKNGYLEAPEYAYGEVQMGIGGGVCQSSTTVYLAALRAGMSIVKREQHSSSVNYTSLGMDATVYWSSNRKIDFVFRNSSEKPVYITAAVQSSANSKKKLVAVCNIYGEDLGDTKYDIMTQVVQELDPPTEPEYVKDRSATYVTYTDQQKTVRKAQKGYIVDSFLVTYVNGVETSRKLLFEDTYKAKAELIYVGVSQRK